MNIQKIEQRFPQEAIKTRRGAFGMELVYVGTPDYIRRLNEVFDYAWTWEVMETQEHGDCISVLGKLTAMEGVSKMAWGGALAKRNKKTGDYVNYSDDLKAASSDALKKACSLFGIGLHLWQDDTDEEPSQTQLPPQKKAEELSHEARVERVYDAVSKYGITREHVESALNKPDGLWDETDFMWLRDKVTKIAKSPKSSTLEFHLKTLGKKE